MEPCSFMFCPPLHSQDTAKDRQRQRDLTARRLNTKAKIIESHKNKTQANHFGSKHIAHAHTFTHTDYKTTPESWPGYAPCRSVLACVQNKLGLSIGNSGGLRPCCLAGAEGAAGCQWSVAAGASGNAFTLTPAPHPHTSRLLGPEPGAGFEKQTAGFAVMDELILAAVQTRGEPGPWHPWSHSPSIEQQQKHTVSAHRARN